MLGLPPAEEKEEPPSAMGALSFAEHFLSQGRHTGGALQFCQQVTIEVPSNLRAWLLRAKAQRALTE